MKHTFFKLSFEFKVVFVLTAETMQLLPSETTKTHQLLSFPNDKAKTRGVALFVVMKQNSTIRKCP